MQDTVAMPLLSLKGIYATLIKMELKKLEARNSPMLRNLKGRLLAVRTSKTPAKRKQIADAMEIYDTLHSKPPIIESIPQTVECVVLLGETTEQPGKDLSEQVFVPAGKQPPFKTAIQAVYPLLEPLPYKEGKLCLLPVDIPRHLLPQDLPEDILFNSHQAELDRRHNIAAKKRQKIEK